MNSTPPVLATSPASLRPDTVPDVVAAGLAVLDQGLDLLRRVSSEAYVRTHPQAFDASIGGHYRHCLDHFVSLLRALDSGEVNYDRRDRDPRIESDPGFAADETTRIRLTLATFTNDVLRARVPTRCAVSYSTEPTPTFESTIGRELVYAIAHAIHHFALIAFLARGMALSLPEHFGFAPSTVAHRRTSAA